MMLSEEGVGVVRRFCDAVSDRNIQSLELLRAIDRVVDWLSGLQDSTSGDVKLCRKLIDLVVNLDFDREIDPDDVLKNSLSQTGETTGRVIGLLGRKQQSAKDDSALVGEHEECVVDEYTATIAAFVELQEVILELKTVIEKHDSELEEIVGPFDTVDELIASLEN